MLMAAILLTPINKQRRHSSDHLILSKYLYGMPRAIITIKDDAVTIKTGCVCADKMSWRLSVGGCSNKAVPMTHQQAPATKATSSALLYRAAPFHTCKYVARLASNSAIAVALTT